MLSSGERTIDAASHIVVQTFYLPVQPYGGVSRLVGCYPPSHKWQARFDDLITYLPEELLWPSGLRHFLNGNVSEGWIIK